MSLNPAPDNAFATLEVVAGGSVMRPGDTLVLRVNPDRHMTPEQVMEIRLSAKAVLPDIEIAVVAADGLVIYRPEPTTPKADS